MQEGFSCFRIIALLLGEPSLLKELLHNAFHAEEIALTIHTESELHPLLRQFCKGQGLGKVNISKLIESYVFISAVVVCGQGCEHTV